jgi:hypothetical protein
MMQTDTIQITSELLALISVVDEFKGAWRALGTLAPERLKALRHVATIESIGSSTWCAKWAQAQTYSNQPSHQCSKKAFWCATAAVDQSGIRYHASER